MDYFCITTPTIAIIAHVTKMEAFFLKYQAKILENSRKEDECMIWQRALKPSGYGIIRYSSPVTNRWHTVNAHRLSYIVFKENFIEDHLHVSHLCHNKKCILVTHLSAEPPSVNADRCRCLNRHVCTGHGTYQDCLLQYHKE